MIKTIKFKKQYKIINWDTWKEVTDSHIISILFSLQKKYGFKILSCKLGDSFDYSKIMLWCNRKDYFNICADFSSALDGEITDTQF